MTEDFLHSQQTNICEELDVFFAKLDLASDEGASVDVDKEILRFGLDVVFRMTLSSHVHAQSNDDQELIRSVKVLLRETYR